jgi:cytochrome c peroxidase
MKKALLACIATLAAVYLALGIFNLAVPIPPADKYSDLSVDSPEARAAKQIIGKKCIMCHSKKPNLPFYAKFPLAGTIIRKHVKGGAGMMDLEELLAGNATDKWAYGRLAQVIRNGTMPITSYLLLHWNGKLTPDEENSILEWVEQEKKKQE